MKAFLCSLLMLCMAANEVMGTFTYNCMKCICEIEGCEGQVGKCRPDAGSLSCGPYQIKQPYYTDCSYGKPDWQQCTKQMTCSETCVQSYMRRYAARCDPNPTCETYARVHNGGPKGCQRSSTIAYWNKVNACCARRGGC